MFGRGKEFLDYTVRPSEEGRKLLAEQALGRIVTNEGVDYLDGFSLPPDDQESFGPKTRTIHITHEYHRVNDQGEDEWMFTQETHRFESRFTNSHARKANIETIASGGQPLFVKWGDVKIQKAPKPRKREARSPENLGVLKMPPKRERVRTSDILGPEATAKAREEAREAREQARKLVKVPPRRIRNIYKRRRG